MPYFGISFWRAAPFVRLLVPLLAGLVVSYWIQPGLLFSCIAATAFLITVIAYRFCKPALTYKWRWLNGIAVNGLMACMAMAFFYRNDITHQANWIGRYTREARALLMVIQEPSAAKPRSYKTTALVTAVLVKNEWKAVTGKLVLYFNKDSTYPVPGYSTELFVQKHLQPITNPGNPGDFDYKQHCAFLGIHHQLYLKQGEYRVTGRLIRNPFINWLFLTREKVLAFLRKYVPGQSETAVAEALLIGYRNDLDRELTKAYSITGVVHIIAISGLHLGMIYGLILAVLKPFCKQRWMRWAKPVLVLAVLWGFSLLAGAAASILRSAVMFSFIVIGESIGRKTNIYNTLAASAFCLLLYNPYFLWDVGFQLSYMAILGIVLFQQSIYRCVYFENKLLSIFWQLNSVTLAAQILTLPLLIYYFHQFPNLFLFTNCIAVPASCFILYGELCLLLVGNIPLLNVFTGKLISFLISQMNGMIERTSRLPFAVTDRLQAGVVQTILLYCTIGCLAWWLRKKQTKGLFMAAGLLLVIVSIHSVNTIRRQMQYKLIVYNLPKTQRICHVEGKQIRTLQRQDRVVAGGKKTVLIIDNSFRLPVTDAKIPVSLIILSGNPPFRISRLAQVFDCQEYVFDGSNPLWKIQYWKKDADSLHLRHHTVLEQGAYETEL